MVAPTAINQQAEPYMVRMVNDASVGPDGPWWYMSQPVDYPDQRLPMLPSISQSSLAINASACRSQTAACPLPLPEMWTSSDAYRFSGGLKTQSDLVEAAAWDSDYAALLDIEGSGRHFQQRMSFYHRGSTARPTFLDNHAMSISGDYSVRYSPDSGYTMDVGFFSLYGAQNTFQYKAANGTTVGGNLTLPQAYGKGLVPSTSYGLHVGSVEPNISSSLILGGYDMSRCLEDPIVSNTDTIELRSIALNVSSGGYAYLDSSSAYIPDLLRANGSSVDSLPVHPRPGVPHLYLPQDTCDAIASHLPVIHNKELDLYLWDTSQQAYEDIMSSPHFLEFAFLSDNDQKKTINVPFALLNLTLTSPIVSPAVQYFPCKSWTPDITGYTLGNAFLQSALLAQNWQTNKLFVAQAPGPDFLGASVQRIKHDDTALTPAKNPPSWEESWSSTLKALPNRADGSSSSENLKEEASSSEGHLPGTIAGIVIGAVIGMAAVAGLVWFFLHRRKQNRSRELPLQASEIAFPQYHTHGEGVPHTGKLSVGYHEIEARPAQIFEMWTEREASELSTTDKSGSTR
ncbi:hypothetical protein Q7P37_002433 [Cladosporium fusiforme]